MKKKKQSILIVGHGRHGKDTLGDLITKYLGFKFRGSSKVAAKLVVYPFTKNFYKNWQECFEDRLSDSRRQVWYNLICEYNEDDPLRLAKEVCKGGYGYTGLREIIEVEAAFEKGLFTHVIWINNPRLPENDKTMTFNYSDLQRMNRKYPNVKLTKVSNSGSLGALGVKVQNILSGFLAS